MFILFEMHFWFFILSNVYNKGHFQGCFSCFGLIINIYLSISNYNYGGIRRVTDIDCLVQFYKYKIVNTLFHNA